MSIDEDQSADDSIAADIQLAMEDVADDIQEETTEDLDLAQETIIDNDDEIIQTEESLSDDEIEAVIEAMAAPEHWSQEQKEMFDQLGKGELDPLKAQEFLMDRHKSMEGDYTRKSQEAADIRKQYEPFEPVVQMFEPYREQMKAANINEADYVQRLLTADQLLNENFEAGIQHLAQAYGKDLNNLDFGNAAQYSPELMQLRNQVQGLQGQISKRDNDNTQAAINTRTQEIDTFIADESNQYANELMEDMVNLAVAERQAGREPNLKSLYDTAKWANPTVREKIQAAEKQSSDKSKTNEARAKANKAKKAGSSIRGTNTADTAAVLSLREELEAQYAS